MDEAGKIFLVEIAVGKNREVKNCCSIEEGSAIGDCKDDFVKK